MAIFSSTISIIGRSAGKSIVDIAARRSKERLYDERIGKVFNHTKDRKHLLYSEILLPDKVDKKFKSRELLWNTIEQIEKRKDSQLARQILLALPIELSIIQQKDLLIQYATINFLPEKIICDLSITAKEKHNPIAYILMTTRPCEKDIFGLKNMDLNHRKMVIKWRESWAKCVNEHLALAGFSDIKVDHRSLREQGIDRAPQMRHGSAASHIKKRGEKSTIYALHNKK